MAVPVRRLGLFANPEKPELATALATVREVTTAAGVDLLVTTELGDGLMPDVPALPPERLGQESDAVVVFGGDGTMLRAGRQLAGAGVPLLGVNLGSLGYLTDIPLAELEESLARLMAGEYQVVERTRVAATVRRDGHVVAETAALNDVVVNMGPLPRALTMEVRVNQATLGQFIGDGLIVSTPTGSTAYNLSAGGPIVHPAVRGLIVTAICPHSLAIRPLLVPEEKRIQLHLLDVGQGATLTADGQVAHALEAGDRVIYRRADGAVRLIKFPHSDFLRAMRHKLRWGAIKRRRHRG